MKKIVLIGVHESNNLGEPLLFDCTGYLLRKAEENIDISYCDIFAHKAPRPFIDPAGEIPAAASSGASKSYSSARKIIAAVAGDAAPSILLQTCKFRKMKPKLVKYYEENLSGADLIVVIGAGTIKYDARTDFGPYYKLLTDFARKRNIPIIVSSAGIESKFDPDDMRCRRFQRALSSPAVRMITTRDDLDELKKYVTNPGCVLSRIADFGIFAGDYYGISKDENSDCIGIGIIAPSRFRQFRKGIEREDYFSAIRSVTASLDSAGRKWRMFTNGDIEDTAAAMQLCGEMGLSPADVLTVPTSPEELVRTVSGFRGIITSRLHSCIVAYSLGVPFVAISWNNKLQYFAGNTGCPERIITRETLEPGKIIAAFDSALETGYDNGIKQQMKESAVEYIGEYFKAAGI